VRWHSHQSAGRPGSASNQAKVRPNALREGHGRHSIRERSALILLFIEDHAHALSPFKLPSASGTQAPIKSLGMWNSCGLHSGGVPQRYDRTDPMS
jgi:hypothetical protein